MLIGLGICDDWSFEEHFILRNDVEVVVYDASVNFYFWLKRILIETIKNPFNFYSFKKLFSYKKFFRGKRKHIKKFVGLNSIDHIHCTFADVMNETNSQNIFLKIDIEGSEYRFLPNIIANEERITGMVIELHDVDIHLDKIKEFLNKFSLNLVHVHANNFSPIVADNDLPLTLELTFSKHSNTFTVYKSPHKLDMPNNPNYSDYEISVDEK